MLAVIAFADEDAPAHEAEAEQVSPAASYISTSSYIQNPYVGMPSKGGTQNITESQLELQNVAEKWFTDGAWNVMGMGSYVNQAGGNNIGYAANIFGQTGQVAGFSFGGFMTIANPFLSQDIDPSSLPIQAQGLPINKQITPQELFAEYQYSNIVQVDAGYIGVNNSPWLTYYQNNALNLVTYQGAIVNIHPGGNWLITALALNGAQLLGETGFSQLTMYNYQRDFNAAGIPVTGNNGSQDTLAFGTVWSTLSNDLNVRLWGYHFSNYANLAYADSNLKLSVNKDLYFTLAAQGLMEEGSGESNVISSAGLGTVNSNMVGLQFGFNYKIFNLQLGYNNIWGGDGAYGGGNIVSPYTYQLATDPLYTTGWMVGMVERSAGQAYKIAPSLNLMDNALQIIPSYENFATTAQPGSSEYDLQIIYNVKQIKGFTIFGGYGYLFQSDEQGGNTYQGQVMFSYLY